ncbi:NfeD family protein [Novosphingobium aquiterrae]|uniref:NfeD family protein n=1 Tax=Novosphingobium aquiterrae TaxID=624388 RepID=A0ABV6PHP9_9SPHN
MIGLIDSASPHWLWLGLGLVLAIGEMVIPGVFLIWLAGAALVTGLVSWILPIGVPLQVVLFAVLAIASLFIGRNWLRRNPVEAADPLMNDRGARAVGEVVVVTEALGPGSGRVRMGDSEWMARGPDAEPGTKMRVTAHDGATLVVEHLH